MGPKVKKRKTKGRGKKKKADKEPKILKSEYLRKIAEQNAILAQARRSLKALEDSYFDAEKRQEEMQEDMADVQKYLEHEIEENEEEIEEFEEKIAMHKKEIKKNETHYEAIISKLEKDYEDKEALLQNQIQLIKAKMMTFEEIRQQIHEHRRKKKELQDKVQSTKARYEEEIYEAEKSVIVKQDTMQKDMETHLTTLAFDFRQATDIAIGETSNKMVKDNINLGNKLTCMQEILERARNSYQKILARDKKYRHDVEILHEEYSLTLETYTKRTSQIEVLVKAQEELRERFKSCQRLIKENRRLQRQIAGKECIWRDKVEEIEELLRIQEEHEETFRAVKTGFSYVRKNVLKLQSVLYEAAKKIKEGIDVEELTIKEEKEEEEMAKGEREENLKDFKYKKREQIIAEVIEKLYAGLHSDTDSQILAPSTESLMITFKDSIFSHGKNGIQN